MKISEVQKALATARNLFGRWRELQEDPSMLSREEVEYTTNELRNSLRSIEWDLEDLEETVNILILLKTLLMIRDDVLTVMVGEEVACLKRLSLNYVLGLEIYMKGKSQYIIY